MKYMWIVFALLAALTAAMVVTLSKAGLEKVDSSVAFAIQAVFILVISWGTVAAQGNMGKLASIHQKDWYFLIAAGILTAISSLVGFKALKMGEASAVTPIERLSLVFAIIFAAIFLKEKLTWQVIVGGLLMMGGAILIGVSKKGS